ncbi:Crp/Fnr family transcriptional regulator [Sphingobacterium sp. JB170]|uniref:Crp/Fnr family transcriptional regulator n=1 Tax=Sphingobacterium sp. JB170 TaxID=1434842 RepID=UPI000B3626D8|nr:Crp/Fnr family transcriptional regulator [Sphingobacterium sp. JB170]
MIKSVGKKLSFKKGDFFVEENEVCKYIGIVESGTFYSYFEDANLNFIVNELYTQNSVITSYRSFLGDILSPAYIKAYSDAIVYTLDKEMYSAFMNQQEWAVLFKDISDQLFINKCFKETSLVKLKAKERYSELISYRKNIEQDFPQHLIASYLKIRPETLSRLKSLDIRQGIK